MIGLNGMRLEYAPFSISGLDLFAYKTIGWLSHPKAHLGVADLCADHTAHDVSQLILGSFGFHDLGLLAW